ncbi:hypothetical protein [Methylomicrobium lacus]|uniref:hypothetical protein n=1 Tax=Methylomicrobium lacus TaxID=136992 RepID=UPI0035A8E446
MKSAFFLVLLANLTLLMYEYHRGAFDQAADVPAPDTGMHREAIVLAGEQKEPPASLAAPIQDLGSKQETAEAAPQDTQPAASACYQAGPFADAQVLKAWSQAVKAVQGDVKPIMRNAQEITGYLLLYPTTGSPQDMKAAMQTLREQGIRDAYPLATGEYKGYISLGMFHRENQAAHMQNDLQGRGVEAVVKPRFKEAAQKYVLLTGPGAIAEHLNELGKQYPTIRLKALPDNDPLCLENRSDQSAPPVAEPAESGTMQAMEHARQPDTVTLPSRAVSAETAALKAVEPVVQKTPGKPAQKQPNGAAGAKPARLVCYEAGPFSNAQSLSAWQRQVAGVNGQMKPILRDGKAISDYLVLYVSSGGAEGTKSTIQMLRAQGLHDAWPLPSGEEKGQISLGVFNREENAVQMQKKLLDKGVNSVVKPRYQSKRQKFALIAGAESIAGRLQTLEKSHPDIKLRRMADAEQNCPKNQSVRD